MWIHKRIGNTDSLVATCSLALATLGSVSRTTHGCIECVEVSSRRRFGGTSLRPEGVRVLDVGSGTGFYVDLWHTLNAGHVTGSDLTEVAVDQRRRRYSSDSFVQFDVGAAHPFRPGEFGVVSMMDVLYHIVDDARFERAFLNAFDVLAPGGLLIFSENFVRHGAVRIPHQASRTIRDIENAVTTAGFEV